MYCLCCDNVILPEVSWQNVFFFSTPSLLCGECTRKFHMLKGERCSRCSREYEAEVCVDCKQWNWFYDGEDPLTYNYSIYSYNSMMEDTLARWKYRGDYQLGNVFKEAFKKEFETCFPFECILVPIPLSDERIRNRAFNQANMLASFLSMETEPILTRIHSEKQSKKTRKERLTTVNPFKITKDIEKPVVLVDDIYTTGTTLRHAAILLKAKGCPQVYGYTLVRA